MPTVDMESLWNGTNNWWQQSEWPITKRVMGARLTLGNATSDAFLRMNVYSKLAGAAWKYSGGQAAFGMVTEGAFSQIGRITRGTSGTSSRDFQSSFLQAAQSLPLGIGEAAQDFYGPMSNAKARMVSMYSAMGRKNYSASEAEMRSSFERFYKEETRAKEVELTGERVVNKYMSSDVVLAQSADRIAASVDRLIVALASTPGAVSTLIRGR